MTGQEPLLLRACRAGEFGEVHGYEGGRACEAGFIYLEGAPDADTLNSLKDKWQWRMFICLSGEWEKALLIKYPDMIKTVRHQMKKVAPCCVAVAVPEGYSVRPFGEREFEEKPFGHAMNYADWADFNARGVGAVAVCGNEIVASASSYLMFETDIELDVSTKPEHRRKGLALACCADMLRECERRGIVPHWDAQNTASMDMALRLGYVKEYDYPAYSFVPPNEP